MAQPQVTAPPQLSPDGQWWWDGTQWLPAKQTAPQPAVPGGCHICGSTPAAQVRFRQHIGMVIVWRNRSAGGLLCRDCAIALFRREMNLTLLTGWWGLLSATILNPFTIVYNLLNRLRVSRWPHTAIPAPGFTSLPKGRTVFLRPGMGLVVAGLVALVLIAALAPSQPAAATQVSAPKTSLLFQPTIKANSDVSVVGTVQNISGDDLYAVEVTCRVVDVDGTQHQATDSSPGDLSNRQNATFSLTIPSGGHTINDGSIVHCASSYRQN